jgi:hypothetical protein
LSRLRILALFAALIALSATFAACGDSGSSDDPQTVVDEATLQGVESGDIDLSLEIGIKGEKSGNIDVSLSGPFQTESEAELPELDLSTSAKGKVGGENVDFEGAFALLGNKAYVGFEGTEYEVDPTTFSFVKSALEQQSGGGGGKSSEAAACQEAASNLEVANFIDNLTSDGSAEVGGTSTTKVSGDLNSPGAIDALIELTEDPACSEQLSAAGAVPSTAELEQAKGQVQGAVKSAHVDLYVGDDHIVRRVVAKALVEPPEGGNSGGAKSVEVDLDLTLTGVNEDQTITAPKQAKPLSDLFLKLGVNPIELLGLLEGQGGAAGIGGLLEGLSGIGGSSSGGGDGGSAGGGSGGGQQAYLNCLKEAETPVDLQNCTGLLQ